MFINIKKYFKRKYEKGFTIIEALVAIMVITIGITPALYTAVSATRLSENIENNLIAAQLVQEGIEIVRAMRDRNRLLCTDFSTGLLGTSIVDWSTDWVACASRDLTDAGATPPRLNIDSSGRYGYASGTQTKFTRTVTVTEVVANIELRIVSTVYWAARTTKAGCPTGTQCVTAESHLYNWMQP
jgi:type II secretory pathway pseudopilin PulG